MDAGFDYAGEKSSISALKKDLHAPDDRLAGLVACRLGPCGGLFITHGLAQRRHLPHGGWPGGGGTGNQRFAPLNNWPDNGNLDKARRLLWPSSRNTATDLVGRPDDPGRQLSLESMGFRPSVSAADRADIYQPEEDIYWGAEKNGWRPATNQTAATSATANWKTLAAVQMGLIYVNPEGPDGNPDPVASGRDIRETFAAWRW